MRYAVPAFALLASLLFAGCSADSSSPTAVTQQAFVLSPADGATGVRLDAPITLTFASAVDRDLVERGVHLISEQAMSDFTCPESTAMVHGSMTDWMADSTMMRHMDQDHATPGRFAWNSAGTACTFQPDSMMTPVTRYMVHIGQEMMDMMERRAGSMSGMPGHGTGMMSGEMMLHFATMDTTGGHAGHH